MQHIVDPNGWKIVVFRFDFSVVHDDTSKEPHFEIEMEYVGNKQDQFIDDIRNMLNNVSKLFLGNILLFVIYFISNHNYR